MSESNISETIITYKQYKYIKNIFYIVFFILCLQSPLYSKPKACCCSVIQMCPAVYDPMNCSTPAFPVLHCLPEFAQAHVH